MRVIKLSLVIFTITFLMLACGSTQTDETISSDLTLNEIPENKTVSGETTYWAKENLDLRAVGELLERAETAEQFEYLLNNEGVNNLDLNGDGFVDYISVAEYDDRDDDQRGFTLFNRFGANEIQEIASIIFNRDRKDATGARVLLTGNEQIYGDNYNYETNWLDKSVAIADWIFGDRTERYESPYYYDNYPEEYETYNVVETPVYRTRMTEYYSDPVFIQTFEPTVRDVKIRSSYKNKSFKNIYAGLAKPSQEQIEFIRNNPRRREIIQNNREQIISERKDLRKNEKRIEKNEKRIEKDERKERKERRKENRKDSDKSGRDNNERYESRNLPNRGQIIDYEKSSKQNKDEKRGGNKGNGKKRGGGDDDENGKGKGKRP